MTTGHTTTDGQPIMAGDTVRCTSLSHPHISYEGEVCWSECHGWHLHLADLFWPAFLPLADTGWKIDLVKLVPRHCEFGGGI